MKVQVLHPATDFTLEDQRQMRGRRTVEPASWIAD
jgi:hypothetical protein